MTSEIQLFVREALAKGQSRGEIKKVLSEAGWPEDEIRTALSTYAEISFPVPVPKRKPYLSAREAFMYLVLFLTLYISSVSFGTLLFQYINLWLPDPLQGAYYADTLSSIIRNATASLLITFPVFAYMTWLLERAIARDPEKRGSKVRKWLTYVTLFIAAGVIIGDLITLLNSVLAGELTLRFVLKVLVVFVVAATIFGYYLLDLRKEEKEA